MSDASALEADPACLFCRIVARQTEADVIWSNDSVLAFRDVAPTAPLHVLVVPRRHVKDASVLRASDGALLGELFEAATTIARNEGVSDAGYRLVLNVGDDAGNSVAHLHLHLLAGRKMGWPPG